MYDEGFAFIIEKLNKQDNRYEVLNWRNYYRLEF